MYCRYCGKAIPGDSNFCSSCGKCVEEKSLEDSTQIPMWDKIEKDAVEFSPIEEEDKTRSNAPRFPTKEEIENDNTDTATIITVAIMVLIIIIAICVSALN